MQVAVAAAVSSTGGQVTSRSDAPVEQQTVTSSIIYRCDIAARELQTRSSGQAVLRADRLGRLEHAQQREK